MNGWLKVKEVSLVCDKPLWVHIQSGVTLAMLRVYGDPPRATWFGLEESNFPQELTDVTHFMFLEKPQPPKAEGSS